jgi:hypothetical protein
MYKNNIKYIATFMIAAFVSGCSVLNQKDPDVIVTTEPMLTKSEEGSGRQSHVSRKCKFGFVTK